MKKGVLITVAILLGLGACVAVVNDDQNEKSPQAEKRSETTDSLNTVQNDKINSEEISSWKYDESVDEMTDKISYYASVTSENSVEFDFPYDGGSTLTFTLRDSPQYGKDAYIRISKGQFNVSYNGTKIKLRVDEKEAMTIYCNEASDNSLDILFLKNYDKIVKALKGAKTMKINVEFFSEGSRTFTFDVSNLQWEH